MHHRSIDAAWLLIFGIVGCERDAASIGTPAEPPPARSSAGASTSAAVSADVSGAKERGDDTEAKGAHTHRAARCGECHEKMHREWRESPHAVAGGSELYRALRKTSGTSCERCHEPLRTLGASPELARAEGVSCEVCHRMDRVTIRAGHAEAPLQAAGGVKFGPRCDARGPYFHKVECKPIFAQSEFCAACHLLSVPDANAEYLAIHSEYADWSKGPYAARGKTCQSCHMLPGVDAELATGEPMREGVPDHGFWGRGGALRGTALTAEARASWKGDELNVKVSVKNAAAGHYIPAGSPGQQIVLRVTCLGPSGEEITRGERVFARRLVDREGNVGSFTTSTSVERDTRIAALATRRELFELGAAAANSVRVTLLRRTDPELSSRLGIDASPEQPISSIVLPLRSGDGSRRVDARLTALVP